MLLLSSEQLALWHSVFVRTSDGAEAMYELHEREQYFFDDETVERLADFAADFPRPCCLCAPRVGQALEARGVEGRTLDADERFAHLSGFRRYDLYRPHWLGEEYGLILCDPPFFNVSLSQLFTAVRVLSRYHFAQPLLVCYLTRRGANLTGAFAPFRLEPTGFHPGYRTVRNLERNEIEFYGNLGPELHARLRGEHSGPVIAPRT